MIRIMMVMLCRALLIAGMLTVFRMNQAPAYETAAGGPGGYDCSPTLRAVGWPSSQDRQTWLRESSAGWIVVCEDAVLRPDFILMGPDTRGYRFYWPNGAELQRVCEKPAAHGEFYISGSLYVVFFEGDIGEQIVVKWASNMAGPRPREYDLPAARCDLRS